MTYNASRIVDRQVEAGRARQAGVRRARRDADLRRAAPAGQPGGPPAARARRRAASSACCSCSTTRRRSRSLFLGAMRIGAVPVPVSHLDKADNFRHFVEDSYATVVVTDADTLPRLREALGGPRRCAILARGGEGPTWSSSTRALAAQDATSSTRRHAPRRHGLLALQLGLDRQAEGRRAPAARHRGHVRDLRAPGARAARGRRDVLDDEALPRLRAGQRADVPALVRRDVGAHGRPTRPDADPRDAARAPADGVLLGARALRGARARPRRRRRVRLRAHVRVGRRGAAAADRERWRERFGLDIVDGIGSTEMLHIYCSNRPGASSRARPAGRCRATSCASSTRTGPCSRARPSAGSRCAATPARPSTGTSTRRPSAACAATGSPPATATSAARTARTSYVGRMDDMLKVGGLWVSPIDMEHVLVAHPRVRGVGVVGVAVDGREPHRRLRRVRGATGDEALAEELRGVVQGAPAPLRVPARRRVRRRAAAHAERQGPAVRAAGVGRRPRARVSRRGR